MNIWVYISGVWTPWITVAVHRGSYIKVPTYLNPEHSNQGGVQSRTLYVIIAVEPNRYRHIAMAYHGGLPPHRLSRLGYRTSSPDIGIVTLFLSFGARTNIVSA